jgi:hypothetical protein
MNKICTLQIFLHNAWHDAATVTLTGDVLTSLQGL